MSRLIETHSARNPRLMLFHGIIGVLIAVLIAGMIYRQLFTSTIYSERERLQNLRRVIVPGPRGNLYDREGQLLVGNRPRFSVVLSLAELRTEFRNAYKTVSNNYVHLPSDERPNSDQKSRIARASVAQQYLDKVNYILGRHEKVNSNNLNRHINQSLLLPYVLLDDLAPAEYARLIERLPVNSPLQVYTSSTRSYPYESAAAHVLGYIGVNNDPEVEDFDGDDLLTFKMKGSYGRDGLEKIFDNTLQGETGGSIFLVDIAGYKVESSDLPQRKPIQGQNLATSLDIELQLVAEKAMAGHPGSAVVLDIKTGEVLVMASQPDFDPLTRIPNLKPDEDLGKSGVWVNRATQGRYPPGSTFKIITSIAALRSGAIDPEKSRVICAGFWQVGNRRFPCDGIHGEVDLVKAIAVSCNTYFYKYGIETGPALIAAEGHRFGFDDMTGIELPHEFSDPHVASPAYTKEHFNRRWTDGDTANTSIGQGDTLITPLHLAQMFASFARGQTRTQSTLLHDPDRPVQNTDPIGLSPSDYNTILNGMETCYKLGTARLAQVPGLRAAAKTGTAQKGKIDLAWMVAFAPLENPQIAIAVVLEGKEGQNFHGATYAGPVVKALLETWKAKRERVPVKPMTFKIE